MILILALSLLQDKAAEELLKKVESVVAEASTVQADFTLEGMPERPNEKAPGVTGTIKIKKGNKVRISAELAPPGVEKQLLEIFSDGDRRLSALNGIVETAASPKTFEADIRAVFGWVPVLSLVADNGAAVGVPLRDFFKASDFKVGEDDGGLRTLDYSLSSKLSESAKAGVRIWIDPKTCLVTKRRISSPKDRSVTVMTETLAKVTLNAELSDDTFRLPEAKK